MPSKAAIDVDDGVKGPCAVNLHNVVTLAQNRLGKGVAILSDVRMKQICSALQPSLGCDWQQGNLELLPVAIIT